MRDERYNGSAPSTEGGERTEGDQVGFKRHQSSNARRSTSAAQRVADARDGLLERAAALRGDRSSSETRSRRSAGEDGAAGAAPAPAPGTQQRRGRASEGDDYQGTGEPCRVCGNLVGREQPRCPHCGAFVQPLYTIPLFWVAVAACVVLIVVFSLVVSSCRSEKQEDVSTPSQSTVEVSTPQDGNAVQTDTSTSSGTDESGLQYYLTNAQFSLDSAANSHSSTYASQSALQSAITEATALLNSGTATSDQISAAAQSLTAATNALVPIATSYNQPLYADLLGDYMGQQVKINGTVESIERGSDGVTTLIVGKDGYEDYPVVVRCYDNMVGDDCVTSMEIDVYGVVTGTQEPTTGTQETNPVIFADDIEYAWDL